MDSCELGAGQGGERGWVGGRGLHWPPQLRLHASGSGRRVEASTPWCVHCLGTLLASPPPFPPLYNGFDNVPGSIK